MKNKILKLLKENKEGFISGQKISEILNVSRTAIWKNINILREEGYKIESVSRKGYRLTLSPDLLTYEEIRKGLKTNSIGKTIVHFDSITSTNTKAKELALKGEKEGTVVIAEEQTAGRGRLGRSWISPKGKGIWMSILLRPNISPANAAKITQIGAASVCEGIREIGIDVKIKWPNDITANGKKVCGILTEMSGELNTVNYIVIGIGINANIDLSDFPEELIETATSLKVVSGNGIDRKKLVSNILNKFEYLYKELVEENSISKSIKTCKESSAILGKEIRIISKNNEEIAKAIEITEEGELIVEKHDGQQKKIISGEISIRGLNGYI